MRSSPLVKRQDGGQLFPSCPLPSSPFFSLLLPFPSVPIFLNCVPLSPLYFNQISTGDKLNPIKQDIKKGKVCTCTHAQCRNTRFATQPFSATTKLTSGLFMLLLFFPAPRTRVFCSPVLCTTASHTMVTSGTMAPFLRYAQFPFFAGLLHHGAFVAFCSSNSAFWSPHTHTHTLSLSLSLSLFICFFRLGRTPMPRMTTQARTVTTIPLTSATSQTRCARVQQKCSFLHCLFAQPHFVSFVILTTHFAGCRDWRDQAGQGSWCPGHD